MFKAKFPLEISLREDTIELLAIHGDELISALVELVAQSKRAQKKIASKDHSKARKQDRADRLAQQMIDGRNTHRILRRQMLELRSDATSSERSNYRENSIKAIASELRQTDVYTKIVIRQHRQNIIAGIKARHSRTILRATMQGHSNAQIATQISKPKVFVERLLRECRQQAKSDNISLFELERRISAALLVKRTIARDDTVIDWNTVPLSRVERRS